MTPEKYSDWKNNQKESDEQIVSDQPNTGDVILLSSNRILKRSKVGFSKKIEAEAQYYTNLSRKSHTIRKFFPQFIEERNSDGRNEIVFSKAGNVSIKRIL